MKRRHLILGAPSAAVAGPALAQHSASPAIKSARATYRLVTLTSGLVQPWSIAFLPDGRMLITERPGRLRVFAGGRLDPRPIGGVPQVYASGQGGLLDICLHHHEKVDGSGLANPLDRMEQLIKSTHDPRLPQWICERAGGFFIRNPKAHWPHPYQVIPATNQIVQEFADMLGVIATASGDNHITKTEAKDIRRRWEDLKRVTEGFVRGCEEGHFATSKSPTATIPTPADTK